MFNWYKRWQQRRYVARPLPASWIAHLERHVPFYRELSDEWKKPFHEKLKIFFWDKYFIGAGGMEITEEVQVVISAVATRLVLYLDMSYYDRLTEIIVYPSHYKHPSQEDGYTLGEAHDWGTVVLSWDAVLNGLKNVQDGQDTATHEFAHVLDRDGGRFNGTPRLREEQSYKEWASVMSEHYLKLKDYSPSQRKVLDVYGALNEAEFFAVATESFFEKPQQMQERLPDLYAELHQFYGWDPAQDATQKKPLSMQRIQQTPTTQQTSKKWSVKASRMSTRRSKPGRSSHAISKDESCT